MRDRFGLRFAFPSGDRTLRHEIVVLQISTACAFEVRWARAGWRSRFGLRLGLAYAHSAIGSPSRHVAVQSPE